jgi:hypothetical protein
MKKIVGIVLGIIGSLFFFISLSQAYDLIAADPPYDCASTYTNCQQCHVTMTNTLYNFVYAGRTAITKWHGQHRAFATQVCATCHTGALDACGSYNLVPTSDCKTCHNLTPATFPDPNSPGNFVTPAAESLPCDWVLNHDLAVPSRGTICLSCHTSCESTVIGLESFTATPKAGKVILYWNTETEMDNAGFNIYSAKAENGNYAKINNTIISSQGTSTQGASYEFTDTNLKNRETYYYKLEDIDLSGKSTMHGPVSAMPRLIYDIVK